MISFYRYTRWLMLFSVPVFLTGSTTTEKRPGPPNILFILVDDLGFMDIGANNPETFYETPNIDRLAASGKRFTNAYAAAPVCSPTRASLVSGRYPARIGTTDWFGAPQPDNTADHWTRNQRLLPAAYADSLDHNLDTIPEVLRNAGYRTFFAGKWHIGGPGSYPEDHGFDINKGGWERGGPYGGKRYFSPYGNPKLDDGPEGEHLPDRLASETIDFISDANGKPFLAWLSFYSVHTPLLSRPDLEDKYTQKSRSFPADAWGKEGERKVRLVQNHAVYAGMVEAMDAAVGRILDALNALNLAENTMVVFTSDNGGLSTSEGHPTSNLPLRAGKGWMYEGGIREPFIVRWPGHVEAGTVSHVPVISTDVYPTLAEVAGVTGTLRESPDGLSLVSVLTRTGWLPHRNLFFHYPHYGNQGGSPASAIRSGEWKLIRFYEDNRLELYNLAADIGETTNLAQREPERTARLERALTAWLASVGARFPTPNPNKTRD